MSDWPTQPRPPMRPRLLRLLPWLLSFCLVAGLMSMLIVAMRPSRADRQAAIEAAIESARESLRQEEALLVTYTRSLHALYTQVHGAVLDEILSKKEDVSETDKARMVDAAYRASPDVIAIQGLISQQQARIRTAKQQLAEAKSQLPK